MDDRQCRRAEITFSVGKTETREGGGVRFAGVAYSGRAIEQWGQRFAVDLSGIPDGDGVPVPLLVDHHNSIDAIAGKGRVFRAPSDDGGSELRIEGELTGATGAGERIATLMSDSFPLRMSIGFRAAFREVEGETEVNGRRMTLDGVFERPRVHEVSFVAVPADPNAGVSEVLMCADLEDEIAGETHEAPDDDRIARLEAALSGRLRRAHRGGEPMTWKQSPKTWRKAAAIGLTVLLSGCVASGGAIDPAVCAPPVETLARAHARALVADGGQRSVMTGRRLLGALKAGCGWR